MLRVDVSLGGPKVHQHLTRSFFKRDPLYKNNQVVFLIIGRGL